MNIPEYDHKIIESKWQERWQESGIYRTDLDKAPRPFYNLMMFPYPSAEGLHVGNVYAFTGADIYGRFKAMQGYDVFEPIGFDAFGIHTENYALKINQHPETLIERNIPRFAGQLRRLGTCYDWSRTVNTTRPEYYRWNQWLFVKLFKAGLAVKKPSPVNWCPACKTVLADEQVIEGKCERCDTPVETRELEQWAFKITDYADRLLDGIDGLQWSEVIKKIQRNWIGRSESPASGRKEYRLHDWIISRQRYWGTPIPIIYCDKCGVKTVPEDQLPFLLPVIEDWKPKGTGNSPLAGIPDFVNTTCPYCGGSARRETDVMDNFIDSSWYYLRYPSMEFNDEPWNKQRTQKWLPVDMYVGGEEHAVLHLMYSRFICMALHDLGYIDFENPFRHFYAHGLINKDGYKMSKSKGNIIEPDRYFDQYGADTLRIYLMFMGPFEYGGDFTDSGIAGIYRFLNRVRHLCLTKADKLSDTDVTGETERVRHITIKSVTEDYEKLKYNTAISAIMEYLNYLEKGTSGKQEIETLLLLLAPLAPHLTEELW